MRTIYGVKINTPTTKKLENGLTTYDWIFRKIGSSTFYMRTLIGKNKITNEEIQYLKIRKQKIGLVLNELTETEVSSISAVSAVEKAVASALELGVPANSKIAIFAEIKNEWSVNHNWMISYAKELEDRGFVAGFIMNNSSIKFTTPLNLFPEVLNSLNDLNAVFVSTLPKLDILPPEWMLCYPSGISDEDISFYTRTNCSFDGVEAENIYFKDKKILMHLW